MAKICNVKKITRLFTANECQTISNYAETFQHNAAKLVGDKPSGRTEKKVRNCQIHWIEPSEDNQWMFDRIDKALREANEELYNFDLAKLSNIQYTKYNRGHFFKPHFDNGSDAVDTRKLTISIQLTPGDRYIGGDLCVRASSGWERGLRGQGDALIFPPYLLHEARKTWWGKRECLVVWIEGDESYK